MIYISHVAITLDVPQSDVADEVMRRWACCAEPVVATRREARLVVRPAGGGRFRTSIDGVQPRAAEPRETVLAAIEECIYDRLVPWHHEAGSTVFHAALVVREGRALMLAGPSNAGKSSLSLAAVGRGWRYFSDDVTVTDGATFWGVPRALQFDAAPVGSEVIARLAHLPRFRWQLRPSERPVDQPALVLEGPQRATHPVAVRDLTVARVAMDGADMIRPLRPGETTRSLIDAAYAWPERPVRWVQQLRPGYFLSWDDPDAGMALLEDAMAADAGAAGEQPHPPGVPPNSRAACGDTRPTPTLSPDVSEPREAP